LSTGHVHLPVSLRAQPASPQIRRVQCQERWPHDADTGAYCKFLKKVTPTQNTSFQGISKNTLIRGHFENVMHYVTAFEIFTIHVLEQDKV
jgi:hypothetical protein